MADESKVAIEEKGRLVFKGDWLRREGTQPSKDESLSGKGFIDKLKLEEGATLHFVDGGIGKWDSTLLIFISLVCQDAEKRGWKVDFNQMIPGIANMIRLSKSDVRKPASRKDGDKSEGNDDNQTQILLRAGNFGVTFIDSLNRIAAFVGNIFFGVKDVLAGQSRMRFCDLFRESVNCGLRALPIIMLISFLMGLIMAFIGAIPLQWFQAEMYVASLVGIGMLRLLAPVMVGIVMAGRSGASYAAELGTMTVNEEVDALYTMGISPVEFLVMPRFLAMSLMMPLLCVFADVVSILGGAMVAVFYLGLTPLAYFSTLAETTRVSDLIVGVFTCFVLGILDGMCGCYHGINCGRSAAAVGQSTTAAVVYSIVCIVIATSLITILTVVLQL